MVSTYFKCKATLVTLATLRPRWSQSNRAGMWKHFPNVICFNGGNGNWVIDSALIFLFPYTMIDASRRHSNDVAEDKNSSALLRVSNSTEDNWRVVTLRRNGNS